MRITFSKDNIESDDEYVSLSFDISSQCRHSDITEKYLSFLRLMGYYLSSEMEEDLLDEE